jgi:hypothetical protein
MIRAAAVRYDSSTRTIKRWRSIGKAAGDPCPLEEPERMLGWWARNMSQKAPDGINLAVIGERKKPAVAKPVKAAVPSAPPVEEAVPLPADEDLGEVGLSAELGRLEILAAVLAKKAHEPGQTKPYLDTLARMGTISEKLRTEAERIGKLKPTEMVEDAIRGYHAGIEREFRGQYRAMCDLMQLVPTAAREEQWNEICDRLFERMGEEVLR